MIDQIVKQYLQLYPEDEAHLGLLLQQLKDKDELTNRRNFRGHVIGDAVVLSPDLKKVLYIHHNTYGTWQQPGGHVETNDKGPWITAEREVWEESGARIAHRLGPVESDIKIPLHIVTGYVLPNPKKGEPEHWHHDFRYGFVAITETFDRVDDKGAGQAKWVELEASKKMKNTGHDFHKAIARIRLLV
jgi:8-oxo-dGTP pyrophosphatase MutT (NUDIX family)